MRHFYLLVQIAAASLPIGYVVIVVVHSAAGTVAVVPAISVLGPYSLDIIVSSVLLFICYAHLHGLREM
nr:hypothetical protein [Mycobacterium lepromatosis]